MYTGKDVITPPLLAHLCLIMEDLLALACSSGIDSASAPIVHLIKLATGAGKKTICREIA